MSQDKKDYVKIFETATKIYNKLSAPKLTLTPYELVGNIHALPTIYKMYMEANKLLIRDKELANNNCTKYLTFMMMHFSKLSQEEINDILINHVFGKQPSVKTHSTVKKIKRKKKKSKKQSMFNQTDMKESNHVSEVNINETDSSQTVLVQPDSSQTDSSQTSMSETDVSQPDSSQTSMSELDMNQPDSSQPDLNQTDVHDTDVNQVTHNDQLIITQSDSEDSDDEVPKYNSNEEENIEEYAHSNSFPVSTDNGINSDHNSDVSDVQLLPDICPVDLSDRVGETKDLHTNDTIIYTTECDIKDMSKQIDHINKEIDNKHAENISFEERKQSIISGIYTDQYFIECLRRHNIHLPFNDIHNPYQMHSMLQNFNGEIVRRTHELVQKLNELNYMNNKVIELYK